MMKYKCVNELNKFDFGEVTVLALSQDNNVLSMELSGGIAKYNNPCNMKYADCYIAATQIRIKDLKICRFFLEGPKYYDADDVLLKEVPDRDIPAGAYEETLKKLVCGEVYTFRDRDSKGESSRICEIAVDVEDDTYWLEIEYEKMILEWDRFQNRVDTD